MDPYSEDPYYGGYEPTMESQWEAPPSASGSSHPPGEAPPGDPTYDDRRERDWRDRRDRRGSPREARPESRCVNRQN